MTLSACIHQLFQRDLVVSVSRLVGLFQIEIRGQSQVSQTTEDKAHDNPCWVSSIRVLEEAWRQRNGRWPASR